MRLVDVEGFTQEEAAASMGVSRKTLWTDLKRSRRIVVEALVTGKPIIISGGNYVIRDRGDGTPSDGRSTTHPSPGNDEDEDRN